MPTQLTAEQRDDLKQHGNSPVPVIDPETNEVYFLVAHDIFERFKFVFDANPLGRSGNVCRSIGRGWENRMG